MSHTDRVVVLVDMDCFYCQVEEKLNPSLKGKPLAVVQYNAWRGGGIIAVNYQARERGVTRHMRGDEAKKHCPEIELVRVPTVRGKANLTKYRDAGKSVAKVLQTFTPLIQRASVDEAYLDITEGVQNKLKVATKEIVLGQIKNTHVVGCDTMDFLYNLYNSGLHIESNLRLAFGGVIVEEIRAAVYEQTGYTCSAGIAHNKVMAKLACGLHKPNKQTLLPQDNLPGLYKDLPVHKIRSLGGKFGSSLSEKLGIKNMAELLQFTEKQLKQHYDEKTALWLYNIARGIDQEPVTTHLVSKSIGCCKKFPGKSALVDMDSVTHWLNELALEIVERLEEDLEENNRKAKQMVVSFSHEVRGKDMANSRTHTLNSYDSKRIAADAFEVVRKNCLKPNGTFCLKFLGISAGKFDNCRNVNEITSFFKSNGDANKNNTKQDCDNKTQSGIASYFENCALVVNSPEDEVDDKLETGILLTNFSDTTEELDEDSSELVFLNENAEEAGNASDSDSISNELYKDESNDTQPQKKSFFLSYFENLRNQECKSPALRDFDTSRILEEDETSDNEDVPQNHEESETLPYTSCASIGVNDIPSTSSSMFQFDDEVEVCKECSQKFKKAEMVSHMDYHVALKIVREESHLYKSNTKAEAPKQAKKAKKAGKKSVKRKSSEIETNSTLEMFLKSSAEQAGSSSNTENCPECHKKVDVASFGDHLDYHAAKKLHLEINQIKSCAAESSKKGKKVGRTKAAKTTKENVTSVRAFFKPVS